MHNTGCVPRYWLSANTCSFFLLLCVTDTFNDGIKTDQNLLWFKFAFVDLHHAIQTYGEGKV